MRNLHFQNAVVHSVRHLIQTLSLKEGGVEDDWQEEEEEDWQEDGHEDKKGGGLARGWAGGQERRRWKSEGGRTAMEKNGHGGVEVKRE